MGYFFMELFKHYRNGTTHIDHTGQYSGYEPSRQEPILSIHIRWNEYDIHVYPQAVTINYKYIREQSQYFTIGRWRYSADALQSYTGCEKKRVGHMYSVLTELLTEQRIGGESIQDWSVVKVLQSHAD